MRQVNIFERLGHENWPAGPLDRIPLARLVEYSGWDYVPALTISQPWASLISGGEKWVENRIWATRYRGPLLIHAGSGSQYLTSRQLRNYTTGAIVAACELIDCIDLETARRMVRFGQDDPSDLGLTAEELGLVCRHKYSEGPFCWVLRGARPLDPVIPCRGLQKLWRPPAEVRREVLRQRPEWKLFWKGR